jgi:ABC-2 type transport system permease protein
MKALAAAQLRERWRSLLSWGMPLGLIAAAEVAIFPSIQTSLANTLESLPSGLKQAFAITELSSIEQFLAAELLGLIAPLALGYLAARSVASGLSGAAESGRLEVLLSAPISRSGLVAAVFAAASVEVAAVILITLGFALIASLAFGAGLRFGLAVAGFANVWPLTMVFGALSTVVAGWSLRTPVVTGSVAGVLIGMYVMDIIGRLDQGLDWIRYGSVFRYDGRAIENGLDPSSFFGVAAAALIIVAIGAVQFERRDLLL